MNWRLGFAVSSVVIGCTAAPQPELEVAPEPVAPAATLAGGLDLDWGGKLGPADFNPTLPNVRGAFEQIATNGRRLGYWSGGVGWSGGVYSVSTTLGGTTFPLKTTSHWEGIGRLRRGSYLVVSSNNEGELGLVSLGSAPGGSGRFGETRPTGGEPPAADTLVPMNGEPTLRVGSKGYSHLGGLSVVGDYVTVGLEVEGEPTTDGYVFLYDFSKPTTPRLVWSFHHGFGSAGTVALTKRPDGHFLLAVGGWASSTVDFYVSEGTALESTAFRHVRRWSRAECVNAVPDELGSDAIRCFAEYQNLNFVQQSDGRLFFVGTNRNNGNDWVDLHEVTGLVPGVPTALPNLRITKLSKRHLTCVDGCSFKGAAGVYTSGTTQELFVYSTEERRSTLTRKAVYNSTPMWTRFNEF